jgi:hypothetical protein
MTVLEAALGGSGAVYERQRRIALAAGMIAVQGRIRREGDLVHHVAKHITDLSAEPRRRR